MKNVFKKIFPGWFGSSNVNNTKREFEIMINKFKAPSNPENMISKTELDKFFDNDFNIDQLTEIFSNGFYYSSTLVPKLGDDYIDKIDEISTSEEIDRVMNYNYNYIAMERFTHYIDMSRNLKLSSKMITYILNNMKNYNRQMNWNHLRYEYNSTNDRILKIAESNLDLIDLILENMQDDELPITMYNIIKLKMTDFEEIQKIWVKYLPNYINCINAIDIILKKYDKIPQILIDHSNGLDHDNISPNYLFQNTGDIKNKTYNRVMTYVALKPTVIEFRDLFINVSYANSPDIYKIWLEMNPHKIDVALVAREQKIQIEDNVLNDYINNKN